MTRHESHVLLFVPTCKIMLTDERFKYSFQKPFMPSRVAPRIMESPGLRVVPFPH